MMNSEKAIRSGIVIPISNIILLPGVVTKLGVNDLSESQIKYLEDETIENVALPMRQNFKRENVSADDFYKLGVTFEIKDVQEIEKG